MIQKICTKCGTEKDISEFGNCSTGNNGKRADCKECVNEARRKRFSDNPQHERDINKKSRDKPENKVKALDRQREFRANNPGIEKSYYKQVDPKVKAINTLVRSLKTIAIRKERKQIKDDYYQSIRNSYGHINALPKKEWKDLKAYQEFYRISNYGNVYSLISNRLLNPILHQDGYEIVKLLGKKFRVHRLVALMFIDNPNNKPHINHIDMNRTNNIVTNLEWCTQRENNLHKTAMNAVKTINNTQVVDSQVVIGTATVTR